MPSILPGAGITQSQLDAALAGAKKQVQTGSPTNGQTVVVADDDKDRLVIITPAGALAGLTVTLPSEANSRIGQTVEIAFQQPIIALTVNGAPTIRNNVTAALLGDTVTYTKVAANVWHRK